MSEYFPNIIGQKGVVSKLGFYLDSYKKVNIFPSILLSGPRGNGKTSIALNVGKNLMSRQGDSKKFIEVNGAEFSRAKVQQFVDLIIIPHVVPRKEVTVFIDEIHLCHPLVLGWLLPVLNPSLNGITWNSWDGEDYEFDFRYLTFLSATTNTEKLSLPLLDRLQRIDLEPYSKSELIQILHKASKDVLYADQVEDEIVRSLRGTPRAIINFASRDLKFYLANKNQIGFGKRDWEQLRRTLGINPLGLYPAEIQILQFLDLRGQSSLTQIAAYVGMDPTTIRRSYESYLLKHDLIHIDGKRSITQKGRIILDSTKKS